MRAGPIDRVIRATWPSGIARAGPVRSGRRQRQRFEIGHDGARLGREADRHVAGLAGRIDPVADVDAGKRRPQRLRHLPDRDAERAGQAAIELHVELRLLSLRRERRRPPRRAPAAPRRPPPAPAASARSRRCPWSCSWICFSPGLKPVLIDDVTPLSCRQLATRMSATTSAWLRDALGLRHQLHEHRCLRPRRRPGRRPRCRCRPPPAACGRCARPPAPSARV